ncbi:hypothetical protein ANO11243_006530 [Dothideomycetidae sp. 11243]|nr:hypothetical protein ANO11243_006530 [fungal sp. No.11243]
MADLSINPSTPSSIKILGRKKVLPFDTYVATWKVAPRYPPWKREKISKIGNTFLCTKNSETRQVHSRHGKPGQIMADQWSF